MSLERFDTSSKLQEIRQRLEEIIRVHNSAEVGGSWVPPVDVLDAGREYIIFLDAPGVKPEDLELLEEGNSVTIAGVRHSPQASYVLRERQDGQFKRTLVLPQGVVKGKARASLKSGLLEIVLTKTGHGVKRLKAQK
jgi:HSP20 family protein